MKLLTACCVAALFASMAVQAQTTAGSGSVVGTMSITASVTPNTTESSATKTKTKVEGNVTVFRTCTGKVEYRMSVPNVHVVETDGSVDAVTSGQIFNALATEAVKQGTQLGYTPGSGTVQTGVWSEGDISRSGSGTNTTFDVNDPSKMVKQIFTVSGTSSDPQFVGTYTTTSGSEQSVVQ